MSDHTAEIIDHGLIEPLTIRPDGRAPITDRTAADLGDYDNYFRIERTEDPATWSRAAQHIIAAVVDDLPETSLGVSLQRDILAGTARVLSSLPPTAITSGSPPHTAATEMTAPSTPIPPLVASAARRWKVGHHLFHLMLAAMNTRLDHALTALTRNDSRAAERGIRDVTALFDAATASMHYASDFPKPLYDGLIRPSMAPPWMPEGFSGVFNHEHRVLAGNLRRLKTAARERHAHTSGEQDPVRAAATQLWRAQSHNRREHRRICERFVPGGDSLLKQHFANTDRQES